MAQPAARPEPSSLTLRLLSAGVMLPVAALAIWLGGWLFALSVAILAGLMYWEWLGLPAGNPSASRRGLSWYVGIGGCAAAPVVLMLWGEGAAGLVGAAVILSVALVLAAERRTHGLFLLSGLAYILFSALAMAWLRGLPVLGLETVIWIMAIVVATDSGAYFTGRAIGGPKLAPRISPKKTWAGLVGGVVSAGVAGAVVVELAGTGGLVAVVLSSGVLAVVAQIGDLLISKAKRSFNIKDSSNLIPGHGGALDRLDGFLAVSLAVGAMALLGGGSPLAWL